VCICIGTHTWREREREFEQACLSISAASSEFEIIYINQKKKNNSKDTIQAMFDPNHVSVLPTRWFLNAKIAAPSQWNKRLPDSNCITFPNLDCKTKVLHSTNPLMLQIITNQSLSSFSFFLFFFKKKKKKSKQIQKLSNYKGKELSYDNPTRHYKM
jgi:hypothetical protein